MKLLKKMNIPNTELIHYYEHFSNFYAINLFKYNHDTKRTMKRIYESNEMNLPDFK